MALGPTQSPPPASAQHPAALSPGPSKPRACCKVELRSLLLLCCSAREADEARHSRTSNICARPPASPPPSREQRSSARPHVTCRNAHGPVRAARFLMSCMPLRRGSNLHQLTHVDLHYGATCCSGTAHQALDCTTLSTNTSGPGHHCTSACVGHIAFPHELADARA